MNSAVIIGTAFLVILLFVSVFALSIACATVRIWSSRKKKLEAENAALKQKLSRMETARKVSDRGDLL